MEKQKILTNLSENNVAVERDSVVVLTLIGKQTKTSVRELLKDAQETVADLKRKSIKHVYIAVNMSHLKTSDMSSGSRSELKEIGKFSVRAIAFIGPIVLISVIKVDAYRSRQIMKINFFNTKKKAMLWIHSISKEKRPRSSASIIAAFVIIGIGVSTLIGWFTSNPYLQNIIIDLRPTNPIEALGLIVVGYGFWSYWRSHITRLRMTGWIGIALGITALLPIPGFDYILFGNELHRLSQPVGFSDAAAVCFIAMGFVGITAARVDARLRFIQYAASIVMGVLSLVNIYGQLYAPEFMYSISDTFVMSFNLAIAFIVATLAGIFLVIFRRRGNVLLNVSALSWSILLVLLVVQVASFMIWSEAAQRNQQDALESFDRQVVQIQNEIGSEIQTYTDTLYGYKGLFAVTNEVGYQEFIKYYKSQQLTRIPGLRSVTYINSVKEDELSKFVEKQNINNKKNNTDPIFIKDKSNDGHHFILTYNTASQQSINVGRDLASTEGRSEIYNKALTSDKAQTSKTTLFYTAENAVDAKKGFFITMPVKNNQSVENKGLVSANFDYDKFLSRIFAITGAADGMDISISENGYSDPFYKRDDSSKKNHWQRTAEVPIINRSWVLKATAPKDYSLTQSQIGLPITLLIGTQLFALLLSIVFVMQNRARGQSLELVDIATRDLQHERNYVMNLHKKDEALIEAIPDGLIVIGKNEKLQLINKPGEVILGRKASEIVGKKFTDAIEVRDENNSIIPLSRRPMEIALRTGKHVSRMVYYEHKNGRIFPAEVKVSPIMQGAKIIGAIQIFRDVSKDYELDKAKSEFVALASHQLRTPLSAVNWYSEMLLAGDAGKLNKDQREYIQEIHDGNSRMIRLISDLLDVSRLDLGRMVNTPETVDMPQLIESIYKELEQDIISKKLTYKKIISVKKQLISADEKLIRMIIQNLTSNAVKYTPSGGTVEVTLRKAMPEDFVKSTRKYTEDYVMFSVRDTGYGIPQIQQDKIYQKLFRADNARRMDVEGTGLGLYVVKQVTEQLGGFTWFESMESIGTTFYVVLPTKTTKIKPR